MSHSESQSMFLPHDLGVHFQNQELATVLNEAPFTLFQWIQSVALEMMMIRAAQVFEELVEHGNFRKAKLFLQECLSITRMQDFKYELSKVNNHPGLPLWVDFIQSHSAMDLPSKPSEFMTAKATRDQARFHFVVGHDDFGYED